MTRVLIATASESTRSWFTQLPRSGVLSIVGITTRDASLAAHVQELAPDVVVIDVPDGEGETIASLVEDIGDPSVDVVLLMNDERFPAAPSDLVRSGIRAVLSPRPTAEELEVAVRAIRAGFVVLEPRMLAPVALRMTPSPRLEEPLTRREIEVLNALAEGLGNKQIAARLAISEHTVKTHLAAIFEKLDASNRTEAVTAGARLGLVLL